MLFRCKLDMISGLHPIKQLTRYGLSRKEPILSSKEPILMHCDNQAMTHMHQTQFFIKEKSILNLTSTSSERFTTGFYCRLFVRPSNQLADLFTKTLPRAQMQNILTKLGMVRNSYTNLRGECQKIGEICNFLSFMGGWPFYMTITNVEGSTVRNLKYNLTLATHCFSALRTGRN